MKQTLLGVAFIVACAFSIVHTQRASGEKGAAKNKEVENAEIHRAPDSKSGEKCYVIEGKTYCGEEAKAKARKFNNTPANEVLNEGVGQTGTYGEKF